MLSENSVIEFHRLKFSQIYDEHNMYGMVRWDTDDSLKVDKDVMALVKFLQQGKSVKEVSQIIKFSPEVVLTVLRMLDKNHFIKSIDKNKLPDHTFKIKPWFMNADRIWFEWIINKSLIVFLLVFSIIGIVVGIVINGLPTYKSFFWTPDLFTVFVSLFIADIVFAILHEFSHFVATKAVGGQAVVRINYRYFFIVAETESYHLTVIPKKMRYYVYFAGILMDLTIVGVLYWFIILSGVFDAHNVVLMRFMVALIIMELLGIIWQFNIFLETDMYNFLTEFLSIEYLRNDTLKYIDAHSDKWRQLYFFPIKKILRFIAKDYKFESDDLRVFSTTDKKKLQIYIVILVIGLILATFQNVFFSIPRDLTYILLSLNNIILDIHGFKLVSLLKSVIVIIIVLLDYIILSVLWLKHNKKFRIRR